MIIFDLDGTIANCEHRRHFVDHKKSWGSENPIRQHEMDSGKWKPDWKYFYEACDKDIPITPTIKVFTRLEEYNDIPIQIWSGRCESVREKTVEWLRSNGSYDELACVPLKMRPIGDFTPDEILKERWLDEAISEGENIDFVFDDRPKVIQMWKRRGIFVFNCQQDEGEF